MPNSFIKMIRLLFRDAVISVNIYNQVTKPFELHRGVHHGCPLASYFFIIVVETLNVAIKTIVRTILIKGIFTSSIQYPTN